MSLAKNVMAMLLITGSLWGCSLNAEKEGGTPGSLAGSQWLVEEIDGEPVLEGSEVTIGFTDEGRVFGSSSCNRYNGGWHIQGQELVFSQMAATRMACPETLMQQENRFTNCWAAFTGISSPQMAVWCSRPGRACILASQPLNGSSSGRLGDDVAQIALPQRCLDRGESGMESLQWPAVEQQRMCSCFATRCIAISRGSSGRPDQCLCLQPVKTGLSEFGRYQCGQLDVTVTRSGDDELVGLEYLNRRILLKPAESASAPCLSRPATRIPGSGARGAGNAEPAWRDASRVPGAGCH